MDDEQLYAIRRPPAADLAGLPRRDFMKWTGTALAASSVGCAIEVPRKIVPYTRQPPEVVPGVPTFYATSMPLDGYASGLLVESREGRPTKIEANPEHPSTLGGTSLHQQASILQLYDDWRGRRVRRGPDPSSWEDLFALVRAPRGDHGARLRILTATSRQRGWCSGDRCSRSSISPARTSSSRSTAIFSPRCRSRSATRGSGRSGGGSPRRTTRRRGSTWRRACSA